MQYGKSVHRKRDTWWRLRYILAPLLLLFGTCFFCSCIVSISKQKVEALKLSLVDSNGTTVANLVPGRAYLAKLEAYVANSAGWIKNVNWNEVRLSSSDFSLRIAGNQRVIAPDFQFGHLKRPGYTLSVRIMGNSYPEKVYDYGYEWLLADAFSAIGGTGTAGTYLENGHNGENGPVLEVEAAYYDVTGLPIEGTGNYLVVHLKGTQVVSLVKAKNGRLTISSLGGKGGTGSKGQDQRIKDGGPDVYGERGFDGGTGGNGGVVRFTYPDGGINIRSQFEIVVRGGQGGDGGPGGSGEDSEKPDSVVGVVKVLFGTNFGPAGRSGRQGQTGYSEDSKVPLESMFLDIKDAAFDRSRLRLSDMPQSN